MFKSKALGIAASLMVAVFAGPGHAADEKTPAPILLFAQRTKFVDIPEIKAIREVRNDKDEVITGWEETKDGEETRYFPRTLATKTANVVVAHLRWEERDSKKHPPEVATLILAGQGPGTARLTIVGWDGKKAVRDIVVRRQVLLFVDETLPFQLKSEKPIKETRNHDPRAMKINPVKGDRTRLELRGTAVADTRFTVTAEDGASETIEVAVRSPTEPAKNGILLKLWESRRVQMGSKEAMSHVYNWNSQWLRVNIVQGGPHVLSLAGLQPCISDLRLIGSNGTTEDYEVIVTRRKYPWQDRPGMITLAVGQKKELAPDFKGPFTVSVFPDFGEGSLEMAEVKGDPGRRSFTPDAPGLWSVVFQPERPKDPKALRQQPTIYSIYAPDPSSK